MPDRLCEIFTDVTYRRPKISEIEAQEQFAAAIRSIGIALDGLPPLDSKRHYAPLIGEPRSKKAGLFIGHRDGWPAGFARNFKTGAELRWKAEAEAITLSPAEAVEAQRKTREAHTARQRERADLEARTASEARRLLYNACAARPDHQYFRRKQIGTHGLLQDREGRLLVSMRNAAGEIRNVQRIYPDGRKFYLAGPTHGLWHGVGQVFEHQPVLIAEGIATAATVREATGFPVVCAFTSGNLSAVAQEIWRLYPRSPIILAGDDDRFLPLRGLPNVGREKAIEAAKAVGGIAIFPTFGGGHDGTDFNDAALTLGIKAVREALLPATIPKAQKHVRLPQPA